MTELEMYKKMYSILCKSCSAAVEDLEQGKTMAAHARLTRALDEAEEFYIDSVDNLE